MAAINHRLIDRVLIVVLLTQLGVGGAGLGVTASRITDLDQQLTALATQLAACARPRK